MLKNRKSSTEYGQSWAVAVTMLDGPRTIEEMVEHFQVVKRRFGVFNSPEEYNLNFLQEIIKRLIQKGWVEAVGGKYRLTAEGRKEAETAYNEVKAAREMIHNRFFNPIAVSRVTLITHFLLALIKLPVGIVSGSVGLLNDGVDTLLDGLSSTLVYYGIRFDKEKIVNVILITIMFATGIFTLYQGVRRLFVPVENSVDLLTLAAVGFSALISLVLMLYQRYIGVKRNNFSLITQSVDSRNHLIVAGGVIVGMVGSLLEFPIVDTLVGIAVAFLILKGAVELLLELIKGEEEISQYKMFGISRRLFKKRLENWLLRQLKTGSKTGSMSSARLIENGLKALNFADNITLESVGLNRYQGDKILQETVAEMIDKGLVLEIEGKEEVEEEEGKEVKDRIEKRAGNEGQEREEWEKREERKIGKESAEWKKGETGKELMLSETAVKKLQSLDSIYNSSSYIRYIFSYVIVLPSAAAAFLFLYYISLAGLSYLPSTHLWSGVDLRLFYIHFPWIKLCYDFTLMNIIHLAVGFCLYIYAVFHLVRITIENHDARGPESRKPLRLITGGYYGKVRHPMYGMMILMYAGIFFSHKSWLSLLVGLILAAVLLINGWIEERYQLLPLFGEEYNEYRRKVENRYLNKVTGMMIISLLLTAFAGIIFS